MEKSESKAEKKEDVADDQTDEEREIALERCATAIARARHVMVCSLSFWLAASVVRMWLPSGLPDARFWDD